MTLALHLYAQGQHIYPHNECAFSFGKERSRGDFTCSNSKCTRIAATFEMCMDGRMEKKMKMADHGGLDRKRQARKSHD